MISNVFRGALRAARSRSSCSASPPVRALRRRRVRRAGDLPDRHDHRRTALVPGDPGGAKVAAGYMRITNTGAEPDRLVGGTFAAARRFELHEMSVGTDNVMRMRPLKRARDRARRDRRPEAGWLPRCSSTSIAP